MRRLILLIVLAAGLQWVASAAAQPYPSRPIRLVVASSPGGVHDVIGRLWADRLKTALGTIVIDNRGGAGGSIGVAEAARAQPDGYTLLLGSNGTHILHPLVSRQPAYDAVNDFEVISVFATTSTAVAVHPSARARTLRDLVDYAKAHPGKLSYGHGGVGGPSHTAAEMFKRLAGDLDIVPIPYKGMGPVQADVIAGTVPMFVPNITGQVIELHRSGRIRILAVNAPARHEALPDIPTATEAGVPGMVSQNFFGIFAPAGTPKPIVAQIDRLTQAALGEKEFQKRLGDAGSSRCRATAATRRKPTSRANMNDGSRSWNRPEQRPIDRGSAGLQTIINHALQQSLIPRRIDVEELFDASHPGALELTCRRPGLRRFRLSPQWDGWMVAVVGFLYRIAAGWVEAVKLGCR